MLARIDDQATLIQTGTSPFSGQIDFLSKWADSQVGKTADWFEPAQ